LNLDPPDRDKSSLDRKGESFQGKLYFGEKLNVLAKTIKISDRTFEHRVSKENSTDYPWSLRRGGIALPREFRSQSQSK